MFESFLDKEYRQSQVISSTVQSAFMSNNNIRQPKVFTANAPCMEFKKS